MSFWKEDGAIIEAKGGGPRIGVFPTNLQVKRSSLHDELFRQDLRELKGYLHAKGTGATSRLTIIRSRMVHLLQSTKIPNPLAFPFSVLLGESTRIMQRGSSIKSLLNQLKPMMSQQSTPHHSLNPMRLWRCGSSQDCSTLGMPLWFMTTTMIAWRSMGYDGRCRESSVGSV
jgi:hypothetical protein